MEPVSSGLLEAAAVPQSGTEKSSRARHQQISCKFQSTKVETNQRCCCPLTRKNHKHLNPKSQETGRFKERNKNQQNRMGMRDF